MMVIVPVYRPRETHLSCEPFLVTSGEIGSWDRMHTGQPFLLSPGITFKRSTPRWSFKAQASERNYSMPVPSEFHFHSGAMLIVPAWLVSPGPFSACEQKIELNNWIEIERFVPLQALTSPPDDAHTNLSNRSPVIKIRAPSHCFLKSSIRAIVSSQLRPCFLVGYGRGDSRKTF